METSQMTNAELKKSLEDLGLNIGPVTQTTRKLYEKKLIKLKDTSSGESQHQQIVQEEVVTRQTTTTPARQQRKVTYEASEFDINDSMSTPKGYIPDGSNLTRRPLYSSPHRLQSPATIRATSTGTSTNVLPSRLPKLQQSSPAPSRSSWYYCRFILPLLLIVILLTLLVYYHMEENAPAKALPNRN